MEKHTHLNTPGQSYQDFKLERIIEISELQCHLRELIHMPTGATVMHIGNEDPENLFCLSFQTIPSTSNGVAHILEHTVLCGSEKFPVKDPFFAMTRRSLNTYMNALTGADFTCYPAASQVQKDFYNLLEVYLDAVFHPNLNESSFLQEGCRLEFSISNDSNSPLEYKGIVYNEMKGALSSPSSILAEAINQALFPDVTYGINSGGDPKFIPQLTYDELKEFHRLYYHPSRCLFFFYGNMPLEKHLDFIADRILNKTDPLPPLPPIALQPRFREPRYHELKYPIASEEDSSEKAILGFAWLTCHILEQQDTLALSVLLIILLDTDASPLKMALLKSGYCKQVSYFIDSEINEIPLGITLRGCAEDKAPAIETLIISTLKDISDKGIPLQLVENAIHQQEFARSEITGDQAPFGLSLFFRSGLLKQHGVDPEQGLIIHELFEKIRQSTLSDPLYFSNIIQKYFLKNPHFVRILMLPDKDLQKNEEEEEKKILEDLKSSLDKHQKEAVIKKALELTEFQELQENSVGASKLLPKISIHEVPLSSRDFPLVKEKVGVLNVFHHSTFTNDIVYADLIFELPNLSEEDLPYLRLLTVVLTQMGCNGRDYIDNLDYIQGNTGGIGAGVSLNMQAKDYNRFFPTFNLRGKALYHKASKLFSLILEIISSTNLNDLKRFREILFKHFTALESRLNQSALKYAINQSASALSISSKIANDLYGLPYYYKLREWVHHFDQQGPYILSKLQQLMTAVMGLENPDLVITCDAKKFDEIKRHGFYGLKNMTLSSFTPWKGDFTKTSIVDQGRTIASSVAFISKVIPTVSYTHADAPGLNLAAYLFDNVTLHARIREQGGAYGGGAVSSPMAGHFYFYSYRDPNILKTLQSFNEAIQTISKGDFNEDCIEEAKLEMIQAFDSPIAPGSRAEVAYGWHKEGRTLEMRQQFRTKLLFLKKEDILKAVNEVIVPNYHKGSTVVFAGKTLLEEENKRLEGEGFNPLWIEPV